MKKERTHTEDCITNNGNKQCTLRSKSSNPSTHSGCYESYPEPQPPTPEVSKDSWEEGLNRFRTVSDSGHEYIGQYGGGKAGQIMPIDFNLIKSFIKKTLADERKKEQLFVPMGVSEWMKHGKDSGYWDYFKEKAVLKGERNRIIAQIREDERKKVVDYLNSYRSPYGKERTIEDTISFINNLKDL